MNDKIKDLEYFINYTLRKRKNKGKMPLHNELLQIFNHQNHRHVRHKAQHILVHRQSDKNKKPASENS